MTITDDSFQAFLNCETKSFLNGSGTVGNQAEFRDWRQRLVEEFEQKCCIELRAHFRGMNAFPASHFRKSSKTTGVVWPWTA